MLDDPVIITDLGGYNIKIGLNTDSHPRIIPNFLSKAKNERRKVFFGDQLNECKDYSGLFYVLPFQKGYLVNWDVQRQLFDYIFSKSILKHDANETRLVISEPQFNFTSIKECMDEIMFEEYHFKSVCRKTACQLSAWKRKEEEKMNQCCLVVDSGFSFTHVVPIINDKVQKKAVKRINVGGKFLTNHLKEIVSYRQLNVLDETYVMNQVKEDCCYVSNDFKNDMFITRFKNKQNTIARDYFLPDYTNVKRGYLRIICFYLENSGWSNKSTIETADEHNLLVNHLKPSDKKSKRWVFPKEQDSHTVQQEQLLMTDPLEEMWTRYKGTEQLLRLNSERFTVPEVLFHPSDIGMNQMGICEAIIDSIQALPFPTQPHFYNNIVITGGNACFEGFLRRVEADIRQMAPSDLPIQISSSDDPSTYAWHGGVVLSKEENFVKKHCVTKQEYDESGRNICYQKFESIT